MRVIVGGFARSERRKTGHLCVGSLFAPLRGLLDDRPRRAVDDPVAVYLDIGAARTDPNFLRCGDNDPSVRTGNRKVLEGRERHFVTLGLDFDRPFCRKQFDSEALREQADLTEHAR